jgi:GH25 family lysozyme M1 (1,4-beta-N-acetylmuramidase)
MNYANGCDTSKYQYPVNAQLGYSRGLRFAFLRASIGDYYSDATLRETWQKYKDAGFLVGAYLVTAPKDPGETRKITAQAHLDRFFNTVSGLRPDFAWVVDAELTRGETNDYITHLHKDVVNGLNRSQGKLPIIYTRQSWWDTYVNPDPLWGQCDLWAARYSAYLVTPWSDGFFKFRDWDDWKFWQYTSHCNGAYFGFASKDGDLDWFNGEEADLVEYAGQPRPATLEERINILEREARKNGWDLTA